MANITLIKKASLVKVVRGFVGMIAGIVMAGQALAGYSTDTASLIETARVHSAVPVYKTVKEVTPREECWVETVAVQHHVPARYERSDTPTLVGGVVGGAIGHAVGHGRSNKRLGAVVGSVLGAAVGHSVAKDTERRYGGYSETHYRDIQRCKTIEEISTRRVFEGYDVAYEYRGKVYSARMDRDPGDEMKVRVSVSPLQ